MSSLPIVLLLGDLYHNEKHWEDLSAIAMLRQMRNGSRSQFLAECRHGYHDGVIAISRTYESIEMTGMFDEALINALPSSVQFIIHNGAGYDQIDVSACKARGISVSNTPYVVNAATADAAVYLLLGALRQFHAPSTAIRNGEWRGCMSLGHDPQGKILGILGMGGIGSALAHRAAAFGLKVQYHSRRPALPHHNVENARHVSFETLLTTSDVISVHIPLSLETMHMIGAKEFGMMKDGVVIVNTARGPIIDEQALVDAVESGKVFGAGLDVYEREPAVHRGLIRSERVLLLPHIGTATHETQYELETLVVRNIRSAIESGQLITPVEGPQKM